MKKSLFVLFLPFLLASCQGKSVSGYEDDAKILFQTKPSEFVDEPSLVKANLYHENLDGSHLYSLILDDVSSRVEQVKVIVAPEDDSQYFFFGYDQDYTLIPKTETKSGTMIHGIRINFRLTAEEDNFKVRFSSNEMVEYFLVSTSDKTTE